MIDLHTVATANGYKVSIMLEELALPYRVIPYNLVAGDHLKPEYQAMNPVGRLPLIIDYPGDPHEQHDAASPLSVYGTAAILLYLAEKTQRFLPSSLTARARVYEWLGIISSDIGPAYTGQFVFNVLAKEKLPFAIDFYNRLCLRMIQAMEVQLAKSEYLAGEHYTIADILGYPVAAISMKRHPANLDAHPHMARWAATLAARPAVQRGMKVPS